MYLAWEYRAIQLNYSEGQEACHAAVYRVSKNKTQLSDWTRTTDKLQPKKNSPHHPIFSNPLFGSLTYQYFKLPSSIFLLLFHSTFKTFVLLILARAWLIIDFFHTVSKLFAFGFILDRAKAMWESISNTFLNVVHSIFILN